MRMYIDYRKGIFITVCTSLNSLTLTAISGSHQLIFSLEDLDFRGTSTEDLHSDLIFLLDSTLDQRIDGVRGNSSKGIILQSYFH
ncbi:hypothetical protein L1987_11493 [Smallanthus sonchifolius]|uniref:Uncharacterized protein n=1 Tax=Smallanthus sonchifolius TaxID=185202 RepID=A0ACB9JDE4_9ASTR|nr:hypothetical protein L1987_11493 [Smallanthus sonchifolius]